DPAPPRRQLQPAQGRRRQGLRQLRPLLQLRQKSSARSLAPNRLFTNDALFDSTTGALISDTQGANTTGKVLRELDPTYTDEVLFGYATPLAGHWSIDAFYLYRTSKDFIEDQPTVLPASTFVVDNLSNA